jgi:hypothetical protein
MGKNGRSSRNGRQGLRLPQIRVLQVLAECPQAFRTVARIAERAGISPKSATTGQALRGVRPGSKYVKPRPGLVDLGLVERVVLDIDGLEEIDYRITPAGLAAMAEIEQSGRPIPPLRDKSLCVNQRYRRPNDTAEGEEVVEIVEDEEVVEIVQDEQEVMVIDESDADGGEVAITDESDADEEVVSATSDE